MNERLPEGLQKIGNRFLIVCEGGGDASFLFELMNRRGIGDCSIGYPNPRDAKAGGKDAIGDYLVAISNFLKIHPEEQVLRIALVLDSDDDPGSAFAFARTALTSAGFPIPGAVFVPGKTAPLSTSVYLIPGIDEAAKPKTGTLEDLLLDAAYTKNPSSKSCLDSFIACIGKTPLNPNKLAKMKLSSLVGASFEPNPWASVDPLLRDSRSLDLIPRDSPHFDHLAAFLKDFCAE
jgi:hypothetical protein